MLGHHLRPPTEIIPMDHSLVPTSMSSNTASLKNNKDKSISYFAPPIVHHSSPMNHPTDSHKKNPKYIGSFFSATKLYIRSTLHWLILIPCIVKELSVSGGIGRFLGWSRIGVILLLYYQAHSILLILIVFVDKSYHLSRYRCGFLATLGPRWKCPLCNCKSEQKGGKLGKPCACSIIHHKAALPWQ